MIDNKPWKRSCPLCNKEVGHKNKRSMSTSKRKGLSCLSCRRKGKKLSPSHCESLSITLRNKNPDNWIGEPAYEVGNTLGAWGDRIRLKFHNTCDKCGKTSVEKGRTLCAHHILPKERYPENKFDDDNGILLCKSCHKLIHNEITRQSKLFNRVLDAAHLKKMTMDWIVNG